MKTMSTEGPLPVGWEELRDETLKRPYFIDHNTQTTTWVDPRDKARKKPVFVLCAENELPFGWVRANDAEVGEYYIDHNTWTTYLPEDLTARFTHHSQADELMKPLQHEWDLHSISFAETQRLSEQAALDLETVLYDISLPPPAKSLKAFILKQTIESYSTDLRRVQQALNGLRQTLTFLRAESVALRVKEGVAEVKSGIMEGTNIIEAQPSNETSPNSSTLDSHLRSHAGRTSHATNSAHGGSGGSDGVSFGATDDDDEAFGVARGATDDAADDVTESAIHIDAREPMDDVDDEIDADPSNPSQTTPKSKKTRNWSQFKSDTPQPTWRSVTSELIRGHVQERTHLQTSAQLNDADELAAHEQEMNLLRLQIDQLQAIRAMSGKDDIAPQEVRCRG